jgi:hypothetical protein
VEEKVVGILEKDGRRSKMENVIVEGRDEIVDCILKWSIVNPMKRRCERQSRSMSQYSSRIAWIIARGTVISGLWYQADQDKVWRA